MFILIVENGLMALTRKEAYQRNLKKKEKEKKDIDYNS